MPSKISFTSVMGLTSRSRTTTGTELTRPAHDPEARQADTGASLVPKRSRNTLSTKQTCALVGATLLAGVGIGTGTTYALMQPTYTDIKCLEKPEGIPWKNDSNTQIALEKYQTHLCHGPLYATHRTLDIAIKGNGFFMFKNGNGTVYGRTGHLVPGHHGNLQSLDGFSLEPPIRLPDHTEQVFFHEDGRVFVRETDAMAHKI